MTTTETPARTFWNVEFFYGTFTITDTVAAISSQDAIVLAENRICDLLDLDVTGCDVQTDDTTVPAGDDA